MWHLLGAGPCSEGFTYINSFESQLLGEVKSIQPHFTHRNIYVHFRLSSTSSENLLLCQFPAQAVAPEVPRRPRREQESLQTRHTASWPQHPVK